MKLHDGLLAPRLPPGSLDGDDERPQVAAREPSIPEMGFYCRTATTDGCLATSYPETYAVDFAVCLSAGFTYADALEVLDGMLTASGSSSLQTMERALLFDLHGVNATSLDEDDRARIARNFASDLAEPLWGEWDVHDYEPSVSASPRRALIQRALELICQFPEAIPENFQGWRVRANVRDPILDGEMTYWLYGREDRWTGLVVLFADALEGVAEVFEDLADLWDAVSGLVSGEHTVREFVALLLDVGITTIDDLFDGDILAGLRGLADAWWDLVADMSTGLADWVAAELVIGPSHCEGAYFVVDSTPDMKAAPLSGISDIPGCCPTAQQAVDLRGKIAFGFTETDGVTDLDWGANHAFLVPSLQHVWLCAVNVDRAAIMYDWFYQLAVRLYAYAQSDGRDTEAEYDRYMLAAQYALRMALSLAARAATWVLHETAHNVSLYHCSENEVGLGETPVYCLQDATARMWWAHVTARLGLPGVETGQRPNQITGLHFWSVRWEESLKIDPIGTGFRYRDSLICRSEFKSDAKATLGILSDVVRAVAIAEGGLAVVAALAGRPSVVRHARAAIMWMEVSESLATARDLSDKRVYGDIEFGINRPLTVGSRVTQCCIVIPTTAGCSESAASTPCWEQPPDPNTAGCCL